MPDFFLIVGAWCLLLALSGWVIERHERTLFQKMSDEAFGDEEGW